MEPFPGEYPIPGSAQSALRDTLSQEDMEEFQLKLWKLLGERTRRYTMGESTSVPIETAGELLRSACFTIGVYVKAMGVTAPELLRTRELSELLREGQAVLEAQIAEGRQLLCRVTGSMPAVPNRSYTDTLLGLETFFRRYDHRFFAHEIPGDIDYQLCHPVVPDLQGIEYINEYLRRLRIENMFIGYFPTKAVITLLKRYCPDPVGLLINLYEPVAVNALGLALLGGDIYGLDMTGRDTQQLLRRFKRMGPHKAAEELERGAGILCRRLRMEDARSREYLERTAAELCPRLTAAMAAGSLNGVFSPLACQW